MADRQCNTRNQVSKTTSESGYTPEDMRVLLEGSKIVKEGDLRAVIDRCNTKALETEYRDASRLQLMSDALLETYIEEHIPRVDVLEDIKDLSAICVGLSHVMIGVGAIGSSEHPSGDIAGILPPIARKYVNSPVHVAIYERARYMAVAKLREMDLRGARFMTPARIGSNFEVVRESSVARLLDGDGTLQLVLSVDGLDGWIDYEDCDTTKACHIQRVITGPRMSPKYPETPPTAEITWYYGPLSVDVGMCFWIGPFGYHGKRTRLLIHVASVMHPPRQRQEWTLIKL